MEKDDEVKGSGEGNNYTTHFRQYDVRLGRWFSPDPLKQFLGSQYSAFMDNPIVLTDPNGGWVPKVKKETNSETTTETDEEGNEVETTEEVTKGYLVVEMEEGDNAKTLQTFLNVTEDKAKELYEKMDANHQIKLPTEMVGAINDAIQHAIDNPSDYDGWWGDRNYNCYASAIYTSQGRFPLEKGASQNNKYNTNIKYPRRLLKDDYINVSESPSDITFGKTIIRIAQDLNSITGSYNVTVHGAVFLGRSKDGTEYVWTKNGWKSAPKVDKLQNVLEHYEGYMQGAGAKKNEGGYYNYRY